MIWKNNVVVDVLLFPVRDMDTIENHDALFDGNGHEVDAANATSDDRRN